MNQETHAPVTFETESVWDAGLTGTGSAVGGQTLSVGRRGEWVPEHLLLLAAESCYMSTLLSLAMNDGIAVLGYVSSGKLEPGRGGALRIAITPCAVVSSAAEAARLTELSRRARQESVTAQLLGARLDVMLEILTLATGEAEVNGAAVDGSAHAVR